MFAERLFYVDVSNKGTTRSRTAEVESVPDSSGVGRCRRRRFDGAGNAPDHARSREESACTIDGYRELERDKVLA